jgi:hypothetical protein
MFCSVCGQAYSDAVRASVAGWSEDASIRRRLSTWRHKLKRDFEEWIATDDGKEAHNKLQVAYQDEWQAKQREERMDAKVEAYFQFEAEDDARLEEERRKKQKMQASRNSRPHWEGAYGNERRYEKYDDGGDDDDEL